jgi:hypothetical protein
MAQEALLSLAERPILHPDAVLPEVARTGVVASLSIEMVVDRLSHIAEAQVHAQLTAGDGVTQAIPGYEYLYEYGEAVAETAAEDVDATHDLARATPRQALKLGAFMAASAVEQILERERSYAADVIYDEGYAAAQTVIANHAAAYQEADQEEAIGTAYALLDAARRNAEAKRVADAFIEETRAGLTDQDAATHAAAFWNGKSGESNVGAAATDVLDDVPYYVDPEGLEGDFDTLFAGASSFVGRIMDGSHTDVTHAETSTPLEHYRRGALHAMAYIALATKEFGLQVAAGIPPRTS